MAGKLRGKFRSQFRKVFEFPNIRKAWSRSSYPSYMKKEMKNMAQQIQKCDVVIEIQDARIPLSGRNPNLARITNGKPHILLLNKMDLTNRAFLQNAVSLLKVRGNEHVFPVNCKNVSCKQVERIVPTIQAFLKSQGAPLKTTSAKNPSVHDGIKAMIVGLPNVGKSSFTNSLRRHHCGKGEATKVGALPGVTRSVLTEILVCEDPLVYLVDTPGIMLPSLEDPRIVLKLALAGTFEDDLIGEQCIADYALYLLNKSSEFRYTSKFDMPEPCDDIEQVLFHVSKTINAKSQGRKADTLKAAQHFIKGFRTRELGCVMIDEIPRVVPSK